MNYAKSFIYNVDIYLYIYGVQFCTNMTKNENDDRSVNHFSWSAVLKSSHVCRHDKWLTSWQQYKTMTLGPLWSLIFLYVSKVWTVNDVTGKDPHLLMVLTFGISPGKTPKKL